MCIRGWPKDITKVSECLKHFFPLRNSPHVFDDLIFYNERVLVPSSLCTNMLKLLHENHYGIIKTQQRARSILYWPNINQDISNYISKCSVCEKFRNKNIKEPLILREFPDLPFQKIATDIFEFGNHTYLVVIDYLSK